MNGSCCKPFWAIAFRSPSHAATGMASVKHEAIAAGNKCNPTKTLTKGDMFWKKVPFTLPNQPQWPKHNLSWNGDAESIFNFSKFLGEKSTCYAGSEQQNVLRVAETHCAHAACTMMWSRWEWTYAQPFGWGLWPVKHGQKNRCNENCLTIQLPTVIFHKVGTKQCHHTGWSGSTGQHGEQ